MILIFPLDTHTHTHPHTHTHTHPHTHTHTHTHTAFKESLGDARLVYFHSLTLVVTFSKPCKLFSSLGPMGNDLESESKCFLKKVEKKLFIFCTLTFSAGLSAHLSVVSLCLSVCLSISTHICMSDSKLNVCLSVCAAVCPSLHWFVILFFVSMCMLISPFVCLSVHPSFCLSLWYFVCL